MKTNPILLLLLVLGIYLHSFAGGKETQKDFGFAKHSAEIAVTPNVSYLFYNNSSFSYSSYRPFVGVAVGGQYVYRPISLFAVSTGLNFHMQGILYKPRWFNQRVTTYESSIEHSAYLMLPIYFHFYKQMPKSTFEFAIGPDFYIPLFRRATISGLNTADIDNGSDIQLDKSSPEQMRRNAVMGLSIFLGAQLHLCPKADLFIGPQMSFVNLLAFDKDKQKLRTEGGGFYDVYMGLKLGFRLHSAPKQANR